MAGRQASRRQAGNKGILLSIMSLRASRDELAYILSTDNLLSA
jgi:hypothetical protein